MSDLFDRVDKAMEEMGIETDSIFDDDGRVIAELKEANILYTVQEVELKLNDGKNDRPVWVMITRDRENNIKIRVDNTLTQEEWMDVMKYIESVK